MLGYFVTMTIKATNEGTVLCSYFSLELKTQPLRSDLKSDLDMSAMWWWLWKVRRMVAVSPLCWCSWSRLKAVCSVVLVCCFFFSLFKGQEEDFPSDHLAEKERERVRERERQRGYAASSNLNHEADLSLKLGGDSPRGLQKASQPWVDDLHKASIKIICMHPHRKCITLKLNVGD